ncbi:NHLP bacteriocin system secretion protein [Methylorubrum zatmanii]|uniref:NHLP bacteriocin system secretion protein n=1 Tax=Methylorubrum zatmanii TaxID=29429 RepID=A0ABW1WS54_9HYPH|nr:NHLP bacteriocin system secretion protein [Methylorubrum zatmanii]MBD8906179.1 NHLP bacteriocin system secretion protein [Methylorubrum zatmanii]
MSKSLYRQEALAGLAPPDRLDEMVRVTSPLGWAALSAALVIVGGCLGWSIFGSYRTTVSGQGLLVPADGAFVSVHAPKAGWIESYRQRGDTVKKGDLLARLSAPEDAARLADVDGRVTQLSLQRTALAARLEDHIAKETTAAERKREALQETIELGEARVRELTALLGQREQLLTKGLTQSDRVIEARERLFAARESISRARTDLLSLDAALLSLRHRSDQELAAFDRQLRDAEGQRSQAHLSETLATTIVARADGIVTTNEAGDQALVAAGQKLMVIEQGGPRLDALLYVPADSGKEVKLGMEVRLSPSVAKKEEYGTLIGTVIQVDESPENESAIAHRLGNPDLARLFTRNGPPLQLVVRLKPGESGPNSYAWTSRRGAEVALASTTLVVGQVTVKSGRPISLFIPALRRFAGV